jgi:hypothetical protein
MSRTIGAAPVLLLSLLLLAGALPVRAESGIPPLPTEVLRKAAEKAFTAEDLARFDGRDSDAPLLMAVRGVVFDVSEGARFYGPDGPYHVLVARDATCAVARMSIEPVNLTDRCEGLEAKAVDRLVTVTDDTYLRKYPIVGHVVGGAFFPNGLCCDGDGCGGCPGEG